MVSFTFISKQAGTDQIVWELNKLLNITHGCMQKPEP
jgi:hypothetical protein